jgi:hypothetical protein
MGKSTNNSNGVNVNSALYTSYSDTCMVKISAWNTNLSIKFHPMKGVNADGIRQYAQDNTEIISTSLTVDNTSALLEGIKAELEPAIAEKRAGSVSVAMGAAENRKVLTVKTDGKDVFLCIAIGVNEQGVAGNNNVLTHTFNKKEYVVGYDPATGSGEVVTANADYDNFVEKLKDVYKLTAAVAHSINYSNALKSSFSSNRQNASNNVNTNSGYSAPSSNYSGNDMGDFLPFN